MKTFKQLIFILAVAMCFQNAHAQSWTNPDTKVWFDEGIKHEAGVNPLVLGQIQNEKRVKEWAMMNNLLYVPTNIAKTWDKSNFSAREMAAYTSAFPESK